MKTANEDMITCTEFQTSIGDYIDDELNQTFRSRFLAHAERCIICKAMLKEFVAIKNRLGKLKKVSVSSDFNNRLKARMQEEDLRLVNPMYRFRLFFKDNMKIAMALPAAAVILFALAYLPIRMQINNTAPQLTSSDHISVTDNDAVISDGSRDEVVNYVMGLINENQAEKGVFLNENSSSRPSSTSSSSLALISF